MQNEDQKEAGIPGIDDELPELPQVDELTALKSRADLMGLTYHPSIGLEKLREKVNLAIAAEGAPKRDDDETVQLPHTPHAPAPMPEPPAPVVAPAAAVPVQAYQAQTLAPVVIEKPRAVYVSPKQHADTPSVPVEGETIGQKRMRLKRHANELIRIRVTCMNPAKKEWEGEIIAGGNNLVGTLAKYIPFGADDGWHVPRIIYNVLRDRMAQIFVTVTDPRTKQKGRVGKQIKEFAIEVMDPLTPEELSELAARQAATRAID